MGTSDLEQVVLEQKRLLEEKDKLISSLCSALADAYASRYSHLPSDSEPSDHEDIFRPPKRLLLSTLEDNFSGKDDVHDGPEATRKGNDQREDCMLCLFPLVDSLHGSFSPRVFKLKCDHTFHLLCLFETIQRRECRKVCGECWKEIEEEEQRIIFKEAKKEKKEIASYSHSLASEILEYNVSSD